MVKRLPTMRETRVRSLGREDLLEKEMVTTPVFLPGKSHGQRSLVGYCPWGRKESDTTEPLHHHHHCNSPARPSGSKLLIVGRILITESILLLVIGVLRFSIS